jgi:hypothetical protein
MYVLCLFNFYRSPCVVVVCGVWCVALFSRLLLAYYGSLLRFGRRFCLIVTAATSSAVEMAVSAVS